ncbi:MAG: type II toxin-antitoxin system mRNA interferase toxin, RelE/StbE family [Gemmatimonadota bacterium]|nr:MAG: type II toxin-antitoxin system mRNA interferase toxin, RelE/StbE family [Gemmatimonadota bacterium]
MAYKIAYKESVLRDLEKLSKGGALRLIDQLALMDQLEKDLADNADAYPAMNGQFKGLRRYGFGNYRIVFTIMEQDVVILRIGQKRNISKKPI